MKLRWLVILVVLLGVVVFSRYKTKKNLAAKLEEKNRIIEEKNKDIVDSINYAKRIQEAILPEPAEFSSLFPESFVLYRPKDIVSGDFYWVGEKNGRIVLAAADCTGHGVPGAFMSMIGNAFLNEIVMEKGVVSPDEILGHLREKIMKALKQGGGSETRDGMDISLISMENGSGKLEYAGANNPLWVVRGKAVEDLKADKQPIGITAGDSLPFRKQSISVQKGDCVYLFTDGYADQFGGKDGKKFKYKPLQELLAGNSALPMNEQKKMLDRTFTEWKGNLEQVDDVLIIGFRA